MFVALIANITKVRRQGYGFFEKKNSKRKILQ